MSVAALERRFTTRARATPDDPAGARTNIDKAPAATDATAAAPSEPTKRPTAQTRADALRRHEGDAQIGYRTRVLHARLDRVPEARDSSRGPRGVEAVEPAGDDVDAAALANQRELSDARQALGDAQLELEGRNPLRRGWDALVPGKTDGEERVEELEARVRELEEAEDALPREAVERARFTVFNERLAELEAEHGTETAARLARQTYYNSDVWNGAALTGKASEGEINAAGLPHGDYSGGIAVGGYGGAMRTPDGRPVDMGHVAAALDWQVNDHGGHGNPFDENAITLSGDIASAIKRTEGADDAEAAAEAAIGAEGDADWNGDIDGNNLAHRLEQNEGQTLAETLSGYYDSGDYEQRVDEWATHSKYIERDEQGVPLREADGSYVVDEDELRGNANGFLKLLTKGKSLLPTTDYADREVVDAWVEWLDAQPRAPAP